MKRSFVLEVMMKFIVVPLMLAYFARFITMFVEKWGHADLDEKEGKFVELVVIFTVASTILQYLVDSIEHFFNNHGYKMKIPLDPAALAVLYSIMDN